jgi:GTP1/Obg family GTP-binding protein
MEKVYYSDKEYEQMLRSLGEATEQLHQVEDGNIKEMVTNLMQHVDVIHREALSRLWALLEKQNPELCEQIIKEDYTVRNLLALYDLTEFEGVKKSTELPPIIPIDQVNILK